MSTIPMNYLKAIDFFILPMLPKCYPKEMYDPRDICDQLKNWNVGSIIWYLKRDLYQSLKQKLSTPQSVIETNTRYVFSLWLKENPEAHKKIINATVANNQVNAVNEGPTMANEPYKTVADYIDAVIIESCKIPANEQFEVVVIDSCKKLVDEEFKFTTVVNEQHESDVSEPYKTVANNQVTAVTDGFKFTTTFNKGYKFLSIVSKEHKDSAAVSELYKTVANKQCKATVIEVTAVVNNQANEIDAKLNLVTVANDQVNQANEKLEIATKLLRTLTKQMEAVAEQLNAATNQVEVAAKRLEDFEKRFQMLQNQHK